MQTKINKELPRGMYRSKSVPLLKVIVHPYDTKMNIDTMTESATEWKNKYTKSKKL